MNTRNQWFAVHAMVACLSLFWASAAQAQKIVVSEAIPNNAEQGTVNLDVEIKGRGFGSGATVAFWVTGTTNPGGITVNAVTVNNTKSLTANIDVSDTALIGDFDIEVAVSGRRGKGTETFSVKEKGGGPPSEDTTPPGPIEDQLRTQSHTYNGMILHWKAPGDDGLYEGTVDHYDIRRTNPNQGASCVQSPETMDWTGTVEIPLTYSGDASALKAPFPAQSVETIQVLNLSVETCYDIRIEAFDEAGNSSGPAFTTGATTSALENSPFGVPETANVGANFYQGLAIDPVDNRPVFIISDYEEKNSRYAKRAVDGTWSEEIVQSNKSGICVDGGNFLDFAPLSPRNANALIRRCSKGRNRESVIMERLSSGDWIDSLIIPDSLRHAPFVYDTTGLRFMALNLDQSVQVAELDNPGSTPEVVSALDGTNISMKFNPISGLAVVAFSTAPNGSGNPRYGYVSTSNGSGWNTEVFRVTASPYFGLDSVAFDFDPNGDLLMLTNNSNFFVTARRDEQGNWVETINPRPTIGAMGGIQGMQIRADGTVFLLIQNGTNVTIGRLCESGKGFTCEIMGVWPELDTWVYETVTVELSGLSTGASMDLDSSGLPSIGWGNEWKTLYVTCQPGISRICEPLP